MTTAATDPPKLRRAQPGVLRGADDDKQSAATVAETLARYIPSEAIAVYSSVLAFLVADDQPLKDQASAGRWAVAGVVAVLAVLYSVGVYRREVLAAGRNFEWPIAKTINVLVAFAAWVCVIPGSPMGAFSWYSPALGAIIGILVNAALGAIALFTESPPRSDA
jgi:hypothetical protein